LAAHTAKFGPEHASVGAALHNIGVVRINSNKFDLAEPVLTEAVRVRKIALGAIHVDGGRPLKMVELILIPVIELCQYCF
jgi:hypothetical protein